MQSETRKCGFCGKDFEILPKDFAFYAQIKTPPPTWCPTCRCMRRMVHRNERHLYKRTCDVTGKNIISIYRPDCPYAVCDKDYYFSEKFDPFSYGVKYDPGRKFFEQFYEFAKKVPLASLFVRKSENCAYNQDMGGSKNCYLCFRTHNSENMLYTYRGNHSSYCVDCFQAIEHSEFLYECVNVSSCGNSRFLHYCEKCSDSDFLYNCTGCVDCFMCTDLRNKQCCFKNQQYSREEYEKIRDSYGIHTRAGQSKALKEFEDFLKEHPRRNLTVVRSVNVSGDMIFDSKNCSDVFFVRDLQNCSHIWDSHRFSDSMDTYSGMSTELTYEATATTGHSHNCHFCVRVYDGSRDCEYSWFLQACSNCFACVGLRNAEYCIFNVKYSKEEYEKLVGEIKLRMAEDKEYGEFFPLYTSPFPYNDTVAQEFFPFDEQSATEKNLKWGEMGEKNYKPTIDEESIPGTIEETSDSILSEVIRCNHEGKCTHGCTKAFNITADELSFYKRKNIPIPILCPNCRHYRRLEYRNPTSLRSTVCMCQGSNPAGGKYKNTSTHSHGPAPCGKKIQTAIKDGSGYIIYCEECYKKEVY